MKLQSQTIKVERNGYTFQIDPDNPHVRYFGGGGSKVKAVDPYAGTGIRELFSEFTNWLQPNVGPVTAYPGQMVPGASPLQQQGFDVAQGLTPIASGGQEYFGSMLGQADPSAPGRAMGMAESGLSNVMQPFDPSTVTEGLQPGKDLAMNTFFRDFMPRLKESMVGRAGTADTGALDRLAVQGGEDLSLGLGAQSFPYLFQGQQNQFGRQQAGVNQAMNLAGLPGQVLGQAGQIGGMGADLLGQQMNIGGLQRGITSEQMGEPYQKWQMEQPYNNPYATMIATLSGSAPQMDYLSQEQGPGAAQFLPGLGTMIGGAEGGFLGGSGGTGAGGFLGGLSPTGSTGGDVQMAMQVKMMFMCIKEGTVIDTVDGPRNIEDVSAGDEVFDKNGNKVQVTMKYEFNEAPTSNRFIELTFDNGHSVTVCDLHRIDNVFAKDLRIGDKGLASKKFVKMDKRSFDLMTSGIDGSYRSNGIPIDTMIPELNLLIQQETGRS